MLHQSFTLSALIALLFTPFLFCSVQGQFGVPKVPATLSEQNGEQNLGEETFGGSHQGFLSDQDAANMEAILQEAMKDVETMAMITKMKEENPQHTEELRKLPQIEIIGAMKETLDNMKLIEYLFKDKEKAVREMEREGMIEKAHIKKYRKNPELLEQDTRRGLYFQFISLAVVGGFME
mmetsp:Transcript_12953/g.27490  ORF Transcript_12953/g.27490 Transcript_12953/m.27490 type:complete len:179 (-) Transcript_12953:228-764(-)